MSERVADGRWFRILTVADRFTRECLCLVLTPSATPQAPMGYGVAMRKQCYTHLSAEDRETSSLGLTHSHSLRTMAPVLGRAPSTVSREAARNTVRGRPYRACTAQVQAAARACQPRRPRKLLDPWLWQYVRTHLTQGCSPEQIAGRLRRADPDDMRKQSRPRRSMRALCVAPRHPAQRTAGHAASGA
jgi:hypothetical protein